MKHTLRSEKSSPLFSGRLWESLSRTHIAVPLVIFYGAAAGLVTYSLYHGLIAPLANLYMFAIGLIVFTLVEYLVHRFAFHIDTDTPAKERFQYLFHGVHHDFPRDKSRLAMPPVASVFLASAFFVVYRIIMGYYGLPFTAGFLAGYACYLCIHYSVHAFRPPRNFLRVLWTHHAIHHFQQQDAAFGVSSALWDRIFGTMPERRGKAQSREEAR